MSSARPITIVEDLWRDLGSRLKDPSTLMSRSELRRALADLRRAQRDAPLEQLGTLFTMIGMACGRLGDFAGALDAHRNAARYEPTKAGHPYNAAVRLLDLERFQQALDALREARVRPEKEPDFEMLALLLAAQAYRGLGDEAAARLAFEDALRRVDPASHAHMLIFANGAANFGAEDDAVEFFARYVTLSRRAERGEIPAVEVIRAALSELTAQLANLPLLATAIERATARWDAAIPEEHQIPAEIHLSAEGWARVKDLVEHPPAPSEALCRLLDAPRA